MMKRRAMYEKTEQEVFKREWRAEIRDVVRLHKFQSI